MKVEVLKTSAGDLSGWELGKNEIQTTIDRAVDLLK